MKFANLFLPLITVCFLFTAGVTAQDTQPGKGLDSILRVIKTTSDPGIKVTLINNAIKDFNDNSPVFDSLLQEAGRLCQANNLTGLKWEVLATKGFILLAKGDYQGAQNSYFEAARLAITNSDSTNYFILQGMIALVNYYLKSYDKAEQYYIQTIRFLEKQHNEKELASVYNNLGMVYSEQKRFKEAIGQYEKSYQLKMQLKDPGYLHVLNNLADANQRQGNLTKATELFLGFYKQSYLIRNPVYMAVANINLGSVLSKDDQSEKALPYLKESLMLCKSYGYKTYELDALQEKNIQVECSIDNGLVLRTDPEMISFIIRNLLTNAIKYSHSFGKITITGTIDSHVAILVITDRGVGISPEKISDILNMETLKSTPGTNGEKGTGLGLHLCKTFMEKLGGELQVESTPGEETRIICIFPV